MTKHPTLGGHILDFANMPKPFKVYEELDLIPLPQDFSIPNLDARSALQEIETKSKSVEINARTIAEILFFSAGLTRVLKYPHGTFYMRAAPATGALYPIELYLVCQSLPGLEAGVYHFNPLEFALTRLREGDYRNELAHFSGENESIRKAPATLAMTSFAWRNSWKYQGRSYRHWFWDAGVIIANLLATFASIDLTTEIITGFNDAMVDQLLCLHEKAEATVALVPLGIGLSQPLETGLTDISRRNLKVLPLSNEEVQYPEIWEMNEASSLGSMEEVQAWLKSVGSFDTEPQKQSTKSIQLRPNLKTAHGPSLSEVILQ
ncbi:MAG: SagB/ThcOx family dehydrogenase, partial [Nitrososphaerales archaeon]